MKKLLLLILPFLLFSCSETPNDIVKEIDKSASIESNIWIKHIANNKDVIYIYLNTYKNGMIIKNSSFSDTIPSLGKENVQYTIDDEDGNSVDKDTSILKDYQIFITVK